MKKKSNFLDLTNKKIFVSLIIILVFCLTYISNYFFYEYVKIRNYQEIRTLAKDLHLRFDNCEKGHIQCIKKLNNDLLYLKPYVNIKIKNSEELTLLEYKKVKNRHIGRKKIYIPNYLRKIDKYNIDLIISKESIPNIFNSTVTAVTFSFFDIYVNIRNLGMKKTLIWYFDEKIYLRSQKVLIFIILIVVLVLLIKRQQLQYQYKSYIKDIEIIKLSRKLDSTESELYDVVKSLEIEEKNFISKIEKYKNLLTPTFNKDTYNKLLEIDPESIIYKSRKVLEKTIIIIYKKEFGTEEVYRLESMIGKLVKNKIISKKVEHFARIIQSFGNDVAHPNYNDEGYMKKDAIMVSNALIFFIEEMYKLSYFND